MELNWQNLAAAIQGCNRCRLAVTRTNTVMGEGTGKSGIMLVGEGPGQQEDIQGRPFVGPAGQLLDSMLAAIGLKREDVYIANIVKCRPPHNRDPQPDEAELCLPYLRAQFVLLRPKIIVCLGRIAGRHLYDSEIRITRDRGRFIEKNGVWIVPTYHPAALLRDQAKKKEAWQDLQAIRDKRRELIEQGLLEDLI